MRFADILKEVVSTKAYAVRTFAEDPLQAFKFKVSISGVASTIGFKSVSGISSEVEVVEYLENMYDYTHKLPGRETVGEIKFERGMYADKALQDVYETLFRESSARRSETTVSVCNRWGSVKRTFKFAECWFSGYEVADLDAESSDVIIEILTMQYEHFIR